LTYRYQLLYDFELNKVFTARRYASPVYAVVVCRSVHHKPALYQSG